jgi:integrase
MRYFHHGKLVEESSKTSDEKQAKNRLRERLKKADTPLHVAPSAQKVTFEDLVDLVQRDYARKGNHSSVTPRLTHLGETFAGRKMLTITSEEVEQYLDARIAAGAAVATANREAACLRHMFKLGVKTRLLPQAPAIELRREDNIRQGFVEPGDLDALLAALRAHEPVIADVVEVAFLTLMRKGNTLRLVWPMLDPIIENDHLIGGTLTLPGTATKNRRPLTMPLTGRLLGVLDRRWQERVETSPYVFHRAGHPVVNFRSAWQGAATTIGQAALVFHDLRRSGARTLLRAGMSEDVVMKMGGWKTRSMLSRYNIVDTTDLADAQAKLDAALAAPGPRKVVPLRRSS